MVASPFIRPWSNFERFDRSILFGSIIRSLQYNNIMFKFSKFMIQFTCMIYDELVGFSTNDDDSLIHAF